ncbi:CGNR zinc finger domain-containing protein [Nocardioides sp. Soil777]|uniref:CGNR zinc finger domain-containing protein n=1 Tax=Nocardioides sp. Soil777 TaxID=1736409 RepID=UPI001F3232AB|nr:CGNR zinc finger domain-containing protein [Nocardioides sp. Soil777]
MTVLLDAGVALVNATTPGHDGTDPVGAPTGRELQEAVRHALTRDDYRPTVSPATAVLLADVAADVRAVYVAAGSGDLDAAAARVNDLLERTDARPRLTHTETGWDLHFHGPDQTVARGWAAGLAAGLALALGSDRGGRLGVCEAAPCDRVFTDTSRNGGRRFCSTRCQNRVKAAAHRDRSRP